MHVCALAAGLPDTVEKQDWPRMAALLAAKSDANATQADGATALHWAAYHDQADAVKKLLAAGAKAEAMTLIDLFLKLL